MPKTKRHILKADKVSLDTPFRLSLDPTTSTPCGASRSPAAASSVRIAQNHPEYAIIEVTCSCGKTALLRCDYAAASPSPAKQEPTQG